MKKIILCLTLLISAFMTEVYADDGIRILIDGEELSVKGRHAIIEDGITMVPFRSIFEGLGAYVDWIPETKSIIASKGLTVIKMQIDSNKALVNGEEKLIAAAPKLLNDSAMVPVRAISEMLDSKVDWDQENKVVSVVSDKEDSEHRVSTSYYIDELKSADGKILLKTAVAYPVFEKDGSEGIDKINILFRTQAKEFADEAKKQFSKELESAYKSSAETGDFETAILLYGYEVTFDKFGFLSILEQAEFAGGDVFYFDAVTFNAKNADILKKDNFLNMSREQAESVEPYSFYLYDNQVILYLNSNNMYFYYYYDYPPSMAIQDQYVKFDFATGEEKDLAKMKEDKEAETLRASYNKLYELNSVLGFKMPELKNQIRFIPERFSSFGKAIGEVEYSENGTGVKILLRKGKGDKDISEISEAEKIEEKLYNGIMVEYFNTPSQVFSCFSIESKEGVYSYSIIVEEASGVRKLTSLTEEIIDSERLKK